MLVEGEKRLLNKVFGLMPVRYKMVHDPVDLVVVTQEKVLKRRVITPAQTFEQLLVRVAHRLADPYHAGIQEYAPLRAPDRCLAATVEPFYRTFICDRSTITTPLELVL